MLCNCTPVSAKISVISRIYRFVSNKKKVIATGLHALVHILGTASIAVAWLMFIEHDWFICKPDFSCCTDNISSRMSINFSPTCKSVS